MAGVIYSLCAVTAMACAYLLLEAFSRTRYKLLFWSGYCFAALTLNNFMLVVDKLILPQIDLALPRTVFALAGMAILLYGVIWHAE